DHQKTLKRWQGREFIGLSQGTLSRLDQATLGLRGLMVLAAAPNVGKTALAVQLGLDAVRVNPEACFVFLSLEMNRADILTRMLCNQAHLDWQKLVLGSDSGPDRPAKEISTKQELEALDMAWQRLSDLGRRILILDAQNFPEPTVGKVVAQLQEFKALTRTRQALILVDYLQAFPLPREEGQILGLGSAPEAARWRVEAMKNLRDRTGEAVLVISEVRNPEQGRDWAGSLEDIVGSSRAIYTPDMIFLLQTLSDDEAIKVIGGDPQAARRQLNQVGMTFNRLKIAKGRDGVTRDTLNLTFFYRQSRFAQGFKVFN
ncbi:MAG: AAA family ATPase, partial [Deltaproteobacteria bacterium]|nr:AAA family ATPase [Deltaproteobacteria bacterium]